MQNLKIKILVFLSFQFISINAQNIFKISNGNVKQTGNINIVLKNTNWVNNSTYTATNGDVTISGSADQSNSAIDGTSETNFYNLNINKNNENAQLNQNVFISNTLTLENGNLDISDFNLDMGSSGNSKWEGAFLMPSC